MGKLSIITPVFNGEKWIERCIKNVIEQACPEAEHIIMDGCSSDDTCKIIKSFSDKYPQIRWVSEKDSGQVEAMNKGISIANGDIVSFLNADDFYEQGILNHVLELFIDVPKPAFVVGNLYSWDPETKIKSLFKPGKLTYSALMLGPKINVHPVNPASYFYHKSIHDQVGMYNSKFTYNMDLDFIIRAVQVAHVKYVDRVFGNWYQHPDCKTYQSGKSGVMKKVDDEVILHNMPKRPECKRYFYLSRYRIANYLREALQMAQGLPPRLKRRIRAIYTKT